MRRSMISKRLTAGRPRTSNENGKQKPWGILSILIVVKASRAAGPVTRFVRLGRPWTRLCLQFECKLRLIQARRFFVSAMDSIDPQLLFSCYVRWKALRMSGVPFLTQSAWGQEKSAARILVIRSASSSQQRRARIRTKFEFASEYTFCQPILNRPRRLSARWFIPLTDSHILFVISRADRKSLGVK
jgi:hypothetical protein